MSVAENRRRFNEWSMQVKANHPQDEVQQELADLAEEIPQLDNMIAWANHMDEAELSLILALTTSEFIGRYGVEKTEEVFTTMMADPAIIGIGGLVHAGRIMELGGTPKEFLDDDDDQALTGEAITSDEQEQK